MLFIIIQVNEKFHKLERVYRDCRKRTRDKTRIIQHTAGYTRRLKHSDQTRKDGISESIIQALYCGGWAALGREVRRQVLTTLTYNSHLVEAPG